LTVFLAVPGIGVLSYWVLYISSSIDKYFMFAICVVLSQGSFRLSFITTVANTFVECTLSYCNFSKPDNVVFYQNIFLLEQICFPFLSLCTYLLTSSRIFIFFSHKHIFLRWCKSCCNIKNSYLYVDFVGQSLLEIINFGHVLTCSYI